MFEDRREGYRNQKFVMGRKIKKGFLEDISFELSFSEYVEEQVGKKKEKYLYM